MNGVGWPLDVGRSLVQLDDDERRVEIVHVEAEDLPYLAVESPPGGGAMSCVPLPSDRERFEVLGYADGETPHWYAAGRLVHRAESVEIDAGSRRECVTTAANGVWIGRIPWAGERFDAEITLRDREGRAVVVATLHLMDTGGVYLDDAVYP